MKIIVIGDIHGEFPKLDKILDSTSADLYLQVGDMAGSLLNLEYPDISKPVYFIAGNHEREDTLEPYNDTPIDKIFEIKKNLWYIPLGHHFNYKGINIGGLGGNYSPTRYNLKRCDLSGKRRRHYTQYDVDKLLKLDSLDILLTHEAPSPHLVKYLIEYEEDIGRYEITDIINNLNPKYHFYGHHHHYRLNKIGRTLSFCVPIYDYIEVEYE